MPRRHIYLNAKADSLIEDLCEDTGKSVSELVADAIKFYRWALEVRHGGRLLVERDGKTTPVIFL